MFPLETFDEARDRISNSLIGPEELAQGSQSLRESQSLIITALKSAWSDFMEASTSDEDCAAPQRSRWIVQESHSCQRRPILVVSKGTKRIYKPRSLSADKAWSSLIEWLGERLNDQLSVPLKIEDRGKWGWIDVVEYSPCSDPDVSLYYGRLGALAAIMWCLGGTDGTGSNFVAAGPYPTLIDAEMVMVPANQVFGSSLAMEFRRAALAPFMAVDTHGIGVSYGAAALDGRPCSHHALLKQPTGSCPYCHHVPFTADRRHTIEGNEHAMVGGFSQALQVISELRTALLQPSSPLSAFEYALGRVVFRPSAAYSLVQKWYFGKLQSTGSPPELDSLLNRMAIKHRLSPAQLRSLVAEECAAIRIGDIPRFEGRLGRRHLEHLGKTPQFALSGIARARNRFSALDRQTAEAVATAWEAHLQLSARREHAGGTPTSRKAARG